MRFFQSVEYRLLLQKLKGLLQVVSFKALLVAGLFLVSFGAFALIAHEMVLEKEDEFDLWVFNFLKEHTHPAAIRFFKAITFFGSSAFLFPAYTVLVGGLLLQKRISQGINIAVIGLTSTGLLHLLKAVFARRRPDLPLFTSLDNYSFPSGHALSSFIFCSILVWLIWKSNWHKAVKWASGVFLVLFSLLVGISRIVLRYHYASDVLAGFCLGFAWVLLSFWLLRRLRVRFLEKRNAKFAKKDWKEV